MFENEPLLYNENPKFRKSLCKKWNNEGKCPYGIKCQFAHGKEQLNTKLDEYEFYWRLIQTKVFAKKED